MFINVKEGEGAVDVDVEDGDTKASLKDGI